MKVDRLTLAWELRRDIHAWILAHPGATMVEIKAGFAERNHETVRVVVKRMMKSGDVVADKLGGHGARYTAAKSEIAPECEVRDKMRSIGNAQAARLARLNSTRTRLPNGTYAPKQPKPIDTRHPGQRIDPIRPWVTTHECGDTAPAPGSRGQGSCVA